MVGISYVVNMLPDQMKACIDVDLDTVMSSIVLPVNKLDHMPGCVRFEF